MRKKAQLISITTRITEPLLCYAMKQNGCAYGFPYSFVLEKGLGERLILTMVGKSVLEVTFYPKEV